MKSSTLGAIAFASFLLQTVFAGITTTNLDIYNTTVRNITYFTGGEYGCEWRANITIHEHGAFIYYNYDTHGYNTFFENNGIYYCQNIGAYPYFQKDHISGSTYKLNEDTNVGGFLNRGTFVYNDNNTACGPPTYTIHGNYFINEGTFIMAGCQLCDGSTNTIKPYGTFVNKGVLSYMQYYTGLGGPPSTYFGSPAACSTDVATVINNGSLCLWNNNPLYQSSPIAGNGCFDVGNQSTLSIKCADMWSQDGVPHTIYLSSNTSVVDITNNRKPVSKFYVKGWGNNNTISVLNTNPVWNFTDGILSVTTDGNTFQFVVGPGYDPANVIYSYGNSGNKLAWGRSRWFYNAPPPDGSRPSECLPCPTAVPLVYDLLMDQPDYTTTWTTTNSDGSVETESGLVQVTGTDGWSTSIFPNEYTTTFTTTESDGFVATDSGIVFATTDKDGNHITTTSLFPTSTDPFTRYTTTFTTTEADGFVATDSGVVVVTYNTDGEVTTKTSLFPTPTDPFTHYTTTFTTTDTDGYVATDSGVVDVTYNTDGEVTTKTSLFPTKSNPFTSYTTTFTTTEADGFVATDSGIVVVTYNTDGELTTKTSLFPTPTDPFTVYTTTFTTTLTDGFKATDSAKVVVTHNKDGEVITSSSFFPTVSDPFTVYTITWTTTYTTL
ncbi:uncharacterized protein RJT21DRAFT_29064 [Scheffersomyces amazonensis]|uniref:uncharacterized protein n=1 Tax=Scheffersomyces amazonensis TaxID=1078765 RepID=UPI00315DD95E